MLTRTNLIFIKSYSRSFFPFPFFWENGTIFWTIHERLCYRSLEALKLHSWKILIHPVKHMLSLYKKQKTLKRTWKKSLSSLMSLSKANLWQPMKKSWQKTQSKPNFSLSEWIFDFLSLLMNFSPLFHSSVTRPNLLFDEKSFIIKFSSWDIRKKNF